jgi:hypothetical protein
MDTNVSDEMRINAPALAEFIVPLGKTFIHWRNNPISLRGCEEGRGREVKLGLASRVFAPAAAGSSKRRGDSNLGAVSL